MMCEDRVAIVTGASGNGMGRSIALTLAREGAAVVVNYRENGERAERIARYITEQGGRAAAIQADIVQKAQCDTLLERTLAQFHRVDICVIGPGGGWHPEAIDGLNSPGALDDAARELAPVYHLMPLVLPGMYERSWGRIIGIGLHPTKLPPAYAYNAAKAARTQAMLLACESAWPHGVTINIIAPGPVEHVANLDDAIALSKHEAKWLERTNVTPQDIADGVAMLCSEAGRFISGCTLPYLFR